MKGLDLEDVGVRMCEHALSHQGRLSSGGAKSQNQSLFIYKVQFVHVR